MTAVAPSHESRESGAAGLRFLWLELTHQCNLQCRHCYADSGPTTTGRDLLGLEDYRQVLRDARALGCRQVQFIGGEPTLNPGLPELIGLADELGFEFIEVYTNLVALPRELLDVFVRHGVRVATSFYSADPARHDHMTQRSGSQIRTVANMRRVLAAGLRLRAGVIGTRESPQDMEGAVAFLQGLGVTSIGTDRVREIGRGGRNCSLGELCGGCAGDVLAVGPDGLVAPCTLSRQWPVGSVRRERLGGIVGSDALRETRRAIAAATAGQRSACGPDDPNCMPNCSPNFNCGPCAPNGGWKCQPNDNCNPGQ